MTLDPGRLALRLSAPLVAAAVSVGCSGDPGATGATGAPGAPSALAVPDLECEGVEVVARDRGTPAWLSTSGDVVVWSESLPAKEGPAYTFPHAIWAARGAAAEPVELALPYSLLAPTATDGQRAFYFSCAENAESHGDCALESVPLEGGAGAGRTVYAEGVPEGKLVVVGAHVYWTDREGLRRSPTAGGEPELVADHDEDGSVREFFVKDGLVYYQGGDKLARVAGPGAEREVLAEGLPHVAAMAVDAEAVHLVFSPESSPETGVVVGPLRLARVPLAGGPLEEVGGLDSSDWGAVRTDGDRFYGPGPKDANYRHPLLAFEFDGRASEPLDCGYSGGSIAVADGSIVWADARSTNGAVFRRPLP